MPHGDGEGAARRRDRRPGERIHECRYPEDRGELLGRARSADRGADEAFLRRDVHIRIEPGRSTSYGAAVDARRAAMALAGALGRVRAVWAAVIKATPNHNSSIDFGQSLCSNLDSARS